MQTFKDKAGRAWHVVIDVSALKRVRGLLAVDLMDVAGGDLLSRLADDPCLLVDVLFALCKPEADAAKVADEDFGRAMVGNVLDEASSALIKELCDFFPSARRARALGKLIARLKEDEAAIEALKTETPGGSSGGSPASQAATPAP